MNWVDIVIILLLASAVYFGIRLGFIALFFGFSGLLTTLFIAGWIIPHLLPIKNRNILTLINSNLVLIASVLVAIKGFEYGQKLHLSLGKGHLHKLESAAGLIVSISSALIIIWITAAGIGALPFAGLSNSTNNSRIVQALDKRLPAAPAVLEEFEPLINPNLSARVFNKLAADSSIGIAPTPSSIPQAITNDSSSIVRITSFGCGGIVDGSGFVIAKNLISTNAHVIAGVSHPVVKSGLSSYLATPVLFDPNQDIAFLRVANLNSAPLKLSPNLLTSGSAIFISGYPKSIFTITTGKVIASSTTEGSNIYGIGTIARNSYIVNADIQLGSSGSPILNKDGTVAGMMYALNTDQSNIAYGFTNKALTNDLVRLGQASQQVGTGACYQ